MSDDERAVRELVDAWMAATRAGDTASVLDLIADDAIFMTCGGEPFGKEAFRAASESMRDVKMDGRAEILDVHVEGGWAWVRNHIELILTHRSSDPVRRAGHALTVLRKSEDGRWRLFRDANFVK